MASTYLSRESSIARPGYNRWLAPPAALAIHLSIGQVYSFSVFKLPLTRLIGITSPAPGDWQQHDVAWIFSIAIAVLGLTAGFLGRWQEKVGPRKVMLIAAICFSLGFYVSYFGVLWHQLSLIYLGYGVIGGIGMGLGYIAPVSTLIRWFPDRPGLATGLAIMGFGGGAMIGSPLGVKLMAHFHTATNTGVGPAFVTMGTLYFFLMLFGVLTVRLPAPGWHPSGWTPVAKPSRMISARDVSRNTALRTPQFWLLWLCLTLNTTAGIGIIEQASPMIQDLFHGTIGAAAAGGFVGLLSLFNMGGRFFWSTISDTIGRKTTFFAFFAIGAVLYFLLPMTGEHGWNSVALFVGCACILLSMYGGGFSTLPAYQRDIFGTAEFGGIYGWLLTAWSTAGILGPVLVNYMREHQISRGVSRADAYRTVLHIMAGLLAIGLFSNLLIRPIAAKYWMPEKANAN
ncbi:MAG: L-lactate MFS transporter [Acidobacteriaceae bacterium]